MALGCKVYNRIKAVPVKQLFDKGAVMYIAAAEAVAAVIADVGQVIEVARIGQQVEVDYPYILIVFKQVADKV